VPRMFFDDDAAVTRTRARPTRRRA